MGNECCKAVFGENYDNYDYISANEEWDQTDAEKSYSGRNKGVKSGGLKRLPTDKLGKQNFNSKKLMFEVETSQFLAASKYFNKQEPNYTERNYRDLKFPPEERSLIFLSDAATDVTAEEISQLKAFTWKRAADLLRRGFVLYESIDIDDIHQGAIGNCYFLSALSAVAEYRERFEDIFVSKKKTENGCYAVRLMLQGIPEIVCIDDYFPSQENWFAGATSGNKEIWVQVMEKAWAKVNMSYASTIAGLPGEALAALTEAPVVSYIHKKFPGEKKDELWKIIKDSDDKKYIMCTNTGANPEAESLGLVESHAYTIISAYDEQGLKLVKIRNPWGQFEWKGDFNDKSTKWNQYPGLKEKVEYSNKDDGIFYMTFDDFLKYYPYTFICKYENNFHYKFQKVHQMSNDHMVAVKINLDQTVRKIAIGLHQKQQRFYEKVKGYKVQMARILLAKFNPRDGSYTFINSDSNDNDKLFIECENLQPGEYHIFSNINWPYERPIRYTISTYADVPVEIHPLERETVPTDYLVKVLGSYLYNNVSMEKMSNYASYQISNVDNDTGFYMAYFHNSHASDSLMVNFSCAYNDKCSFYSSCLVSNRNENKENKVTNDSFNFVIPPEGKQMLTWRLLGNPWTAKFQPSQISCQTTTAEVPRKIEPDSESQYRCLIEGCLKTLHKENLSLDCFYSELDIEDGVLVIFENKSRSTFRFKVTFPNLTNLDVVYPKKSQKLIFNVPSGLFSYIRLQKMNNNDEHFFNISYSFKKLY